MTDQHNYQELMSRVKGVCDNNQYLENQMKMQTKRIRTRNELISFVLYHEFGIPYNSSRFDAEPEKYILKIKELLKQKKEAKE